jgi:hypothetical protein
MQEADRKAWRELLNNCFPLDGASQSFGDLAAKSCKQRNFMKNF